MWGFTSNVRVWYGRCRRGRESLLCLVTVVQLVDTRPEVASGYIDGYLE